MSESIDTVSATLNPDTKKPGRRQSILKNAAEEDIISNLTHTLGGQKPRSWSRRRQITESGSHHSSTYPMAHVQEKARSNSECSGEFRNRLREFVEKRRNSTSSEIMIRQHLSKVRSIKIPD